MKLVDPSVTILTPKHVIESNQIIMERAGRVCYKSESRITGSSSDKFIKMIIKSGHTSVLEHSILTVKFVTDRAIANELVRHRHSAFSQESTRYCNYSTGKFDGELTFIRPIWYEDNPDIHTAKCDILAKKLFDKYVEEAEDVYLAMIARGLKPEEARCVLPLCTKTELVMSASYREWRSVFELRCDPHAHPEIRDLMQKLLYECKKNVPIIFDDIDWNGHVNNQVS